MASYSGTVVLTGMISPTDTTDLYPTHEDKLGKGGYVAVDTLFDRNAIPSLRRKVGMLVFVNADDKIYQLKGGIDNVNWTEFVLTGTGTTGETSLIQTAISVSGIITSLFSGIPVPSGELLYIIGDAGNINPEVFSGELNVILSEHKIHEFVIVYNGVNATVYKNQTLSDAYIQNIVAVYPRDYGVVNLIANPLSAKLVNILSQTYTDSVQVYSISGIVSKIDKYSNHFKALLDGDDFIVIFDGINYSAYKKNNINIEDLKSRMIIR